MMILNQIKPKGVNEMKNYSTIKNADGENFVRVAGYSIPTKGVELLSYENNFDYRGKFNIQRIYEHGGQLCLEGEDVESGEIIGMTVEDNKMVIMDVFTQLEWENQKPIYDDADKKILWQRVEINDREFKVRDGIIRDAGKFEGEMVYVPHFWENVIMYSGEVDQVKYNNVLIHKVKVREGDREKFPELEGVDYVYLFEDHNGFVKENDLNESDFEKIKEKSQYWGELESFVTDLSMNIDFVSVYDLQPYNWGMIEIDWDKTPEGEPIYNLPEDVSARLQNYDHIYINHFSNSIGRKKSTITFTHSKLDQLS